MQHNKSGEKQGTEVTSDTTTDASIHGNYVNNSHLQCLHLLYKQK